MIYLLYNPKSNNENNDLNVVLEGKSEYNVKSISLLECDVKELIATLTPEDKLLVCGGDGTISRFASNNYGVEFPCPVHVLKSGTGNDFVRDINENEVEKIEKLKDIRPYLKNLPTVEAGDVKARFINGAGFGLDGEVCLEVENQKKRSRKKANFTLAALKLILSSYKKTKARVVVDGVERVYEDVWMVSAMKGRFYGGGMMITPDQDRDGENMSVMVFHGCSRLRALTIFLTVFKGTHVKYKNIIDIVEGKNLYVEYDRPTVLQIDGDVVMDVQSFKAYMDGHETV